MKKIFPEWQKTVCPTEKMFEYYKKLFLRNQNKWIRRSKLEPYHLGQEFKKDKKLYKLLGSVDIKNNMIINEIGTNNYYFIHSDEIDYYLLNKDI